MSGTEHPSLDPVPPGSLPPGSLPPGSLPPGSVVLGDRVGADRARTARRWALAVLTVATLALAAYLAVVVAAAWFVVSVVDAVLDREPAAFDVTGLLTDAAPGVLVGWVVGLVAAAALGRGEALGARGAGIAGGSLGAMVGAAVLAATGVL